MEENTNQTPKFNIPHQVDYGEMMDFATKDGTQLQREVITDTYVTADENEDSMMEQLNNAAKSLEGKTRGFAGYFSFYYLMLTMFYIMRKYDNCLKVLDRIDYGADALERHILTGNFLDENGKDTGFTNFSFGESEEELKNNMKFVVDTYNTAKLIHMKASSFESGYSLLVASIMLHGYNKQKGMMNSDAQGIRKLSEHIRKFIVDERDSGDITPSADMSFCNIEDLKPQTD